MKQRGFTLLELLVVVGIIAILAAFAIPNYQEYVLRGHRVDARNSLQEVAQRLEQNYSISRNWARTPGASSDNISNSTINGTWGLQYSPRGASASRARYEISLVQIDETGYQLQARAINAQLRDKCKYFFLNQSGVKQASRNNTPLSSRDALSQECWHR